MRKIALMEAADLYDVRAGLDATAGRLLALFRRRNLLSPMAIPRFAEENSAIVDRLAARNAAGAAQALFEHAQGGKARIPRDGEIRGTSDAP